MGKQRGIKKNHKGFTLIEALMVIALIGIALAVSAPYLVNSIRGQRIRTASRTMAMSAKYARSMAVLNQTDVSIEFDLENGNVRITSGNASLPAFSRELQGVRLAYVQVYDSEPASEGTATVLCRRTGICDPFKAKIEDTHGNHLIIRVDTLGSATVKQDG